MSVSKIGALMACMAVLLCVSSVAQADADTQLFEGFVFGIAFGEIPNVEECKKEVSGVVHEFRDAFRNFEIHDRTHLKEGLKRTAAGINEFVHALDNCGATYAAEKIAEVVGEMATGYGSIIEGVKIVVKSVDIYDDVTAAHSDWKRGDYFGTGEELGKLVMTLA